MDDFALTPAERALGVVVGMLSLERVIASKRSTTRPKGTSFEVARRWRTPPPRRSR